MYKLTYFLGKVNDNLQLNAVMYIADDNSLALSTFKNKESFKTIQRFKISGDEYFRFSPRPKIEIVIDPLQKDQYDPNKHIRCNKMDVFKMIRALERINHLFRTVTDLYYYYEGKLVLDDTKKDEVSDIIRLTDKTLKVVPTIIVDNDSGKQHEGIILYSNNESASCHLTYLEMCYLIYLLKNSDIDSIMSLTYMIDKLDKNPKFETLDIKQKPITNENPDIDNTVSYAAIKEGNTIPNI